VSAPVDMLSFRLYSHARSISSNRLGAEGVAALAEGLKGNSTLQVLESANWHSNRPFKCSPFCQRPLTEKQTLFIPTGSTGMASDQKAEQLSQRASKATRP